jgi:hypothetical protein
MKTIYNDAGQKRSHSGLLTSQHEVNRLDNLFYKEIDSAFYLPDYGIEWFFFESPKVEISVDGFLNHLTRKATTMGIIFQSIEKTTSDFTLSLDITLLSEEKAYLRR